jgi:SAM-dependent methyltransferase
MEPFDTSAVRAAYDTVAEAYAEAFADDLLQLPLARQVLDSFVERLAAGELVLDLGCGPGQVGQYLAERGLRIVGMDLAENMLRVARQRTGIARLACGDMRAMPLRSGSFSGVAAFYSVHNLPRPALGTALAEINESSNHQALWSSPRIWAIVRCAATSSRVTPLTPWEALSTVIMSYSRRWTASRSWSKKSTIATRCLTNTIPKGSIRHADEQRHDPLLDGPREPERP